MPAPEMISYEVFIQNVQEADLRMLSLLAGGDTMKTQDPVEAEVFKAQGIRLFSAGLLGRFRQSIEVLADDVWYVHDALVKPVALTYVAQCAKERVMLSRDPVVTPPSE